MKPLRSPLFDFPDNEIPAALANVLSRLLGLPVNRSFVQLNSVGHTGADGFKRLANQALFPGAAVQGATCLIVDDFVGQGGTLANLIGFIRSQGSEVLGASVLTGKPYSAKLAPDEAQVNALKHKHGRELEMDFPGFCGHVNLTLKGAPRSCDVHEVQLGKDAASL